MNRLMLAAFCCSIAMPVVADPVKDSAFIATQTVTREALQVTFEAFTPMLGQVVEYQLSQNEIQLDDPDTFASLIREEFEAVFLQELRAQTAAVQIELFSENELAEIATFYGTDAGKALIRNTPLLMARGQQVGQQLGVVALQEAGFRLATRIAEEGLSFSSDPAVTEKLLGLLSR